MAEVKFMKGNEALAEAAIRAGMQGYFGYPITPQSEVVEYLAQEAPNHDYVLVQAESEVASINMVYGAAGAGARAMTSTSSPGYSLMQEGMSYLACAELPCVVANVVRGGPGLGTIQPSQGDYFQAVKGGGHGDYRLITLAPASVHEMAEHAHLGFELACKWRNPAMILTDGVIGQMMEPVDLDAIPVVDWKKPDWAMGVNRTGRKPNLVTSIWLDPEDMAQKHLEIIDKYERLKAAEVRFEEYMCDDAEVLCVAYGSVSRAVMGTVRKLREEGMKIGLLRPITLWPYPYATLRELAKKVKSVVTYEMSWGQMIEDVALATRLNPVPLHFVPRHGGLTFNPNDVETPLRAIYANPQNSDTLWEIS